MPQQVSRLVVVFVIAAGGLVLARRYLVPETFGQQGHYRAAAVDSLIAHQEKYAGFQACSLCHSPIAQQRLVSNHRGVTCEVCHGPSANHAAAPLDVKPAAPRQRGFCPLCHAYNPSRPTGFPQIDPVAHNPLTPCIACHDPHQPEPPVTPEACSACHGQIARQKAVSHHATLPCETCHEAPAEHKIAPRTVRPTKPQQRSFCGTCHSDVGDPIGFAPQINLRAHEPRYLCWQCHYPHYPETS